jgi:hypothetical protein
MDLVSTAIVAALSDIVGGAGQAVGGNFANEAYEKLKATPKRRYGGDSGVVKLVGNPEAKPDSPGCEQTLEEEVKASGANQDHEMCQAAQGLLDQLRAPPSGEHHIQNAVGSYIAQADAAAPPR